MSHRTSPPEVFLHPGDLWFGGEGARVRTILGSCVAITLWHPQQQIGGMCHYMLPGTGLDGRYAEKAIGLLREQIARSGTRPHEYEAKLFGGGRMFALMTGKHTDIPAVPDRNIAVARELMARYGFRIKAEHMGGEGHRNVIFEVANGNVWVRQTPLVPQPLPLPIHFKRCQ